VTSPHRLHVRLEGEGKQEEEEEEEQKQQQKQRTNISKNNYNETRHCLIPRT
jgi:hypothetical protein